MRSGYFPVPTPLACRSVLATKRLIECQVVDLPFHLPAASGATSAMEDSESKLVVCIVLWHNRSLLCSSPFNLRTSQSPQRGGTGGDNVSPSPLSPSAIDRYRSCPRRYLWQDVERRPIDSQLTKWLSELHEYVEGALRRAVPEALA